MKRITVAVLALAASISVPGQAQQVERAERRVLDVARQLKNGQFVWAPELSPSGPLLMVVNLESQRAVLFRNGIPIGASTVSSGAEGHETPTGVFTILQKNIDHKSNLYNDAPMPYMQRLTWGGVALHAGNLPGYPQSHGCIRLPGDAARQLFREVPIGTVVTIR